MQPTGFNRAASIGQAVGEGLSDLLGGIAQQKATQMKAKQYEQMGLPPGLASLEPQVQSALIKQHGQQQRDLLRLAALQSEELGGTEHTGLRSLGAPETTEQLTASEEITPRGVDIQESVSELNASDRRLKGEAKPLPHSQEKIKQLEALGYTQEANRRQRENEAVQKENLTREKLSFQEEQSRRKFAQPYMEKLGEKAEAATEALHVANEMEKILDEGGLISPYLNRIYAHLGVEDLSALKGASAEQFQGLTKQFMKQMKSIFGSRITDRDLQTFLQTIPTLMNSEAGKRLLLNQSRLLSEGALLRNQVADEILAENGGVPPYDFQRMVESRSRPKLDALSSRIGRENDKIRKYAKAPNKQKKGLELLSKSGSTAEEGFMLMVDRKGKSVQVPEDRSEEAFASGYLYG